MSYKNDCGEGCLPSVTSHECNKQICEMSLPVKCITNDYVGSEVFLGQDGLPLDSLDKILKSFDIRLKAIEQAIIEINNKI